MNWLVLCRLSVLYWSACMLCMLCVYYVVSAFFTGLLVCCVCCVCIMWSQRSLLVCLYVVCLLLMLFSLCDNCLLVNKNSPAKPVKEDIGAFLTDAEFTYEDYAQQSSGAGFATLRVQDYSWEDNGYSLAHELYGDIAELLEDKFQTTQNLTYFTCVEFSLHSVTCVTCILTVICCSNDAIFLMWMMEVQSFFHLKQFLLVVLVTFDIFSHTQCRWIL